MLLDLQVEGMRSSGGKICCIVREKHLLFPKKMDFDVDGLEVVSGQAESLLLLVGLAALVVFAKAETVSAAGVGVHSSAARLMPVTAMLQCHAMSMSYCDSVCLVQALSRLWSSLV